MSVSEGLGVSFSDTNTKTFFLRFERKNAGKLGFEIQKVFPTLQDLGVGVRFPDIKNSGVGVSDRTSFW